MPTFCAKLLENCLSCLPLLPWVWRTPARSGMTMSRWTTASYFACQHHQTSTASLSIQFGLRLGLLSPSFSKSCAIPGRSSSSWRAVFGALEKPTSCRWPTGLHRKKAARQRRSRLSGHPRYEPHPGQASLAHPLPGR